MKIMAAVDLSKQADLVVTEAAKLAKTQNAELVLITVSEDMDDFGEGLGLNIAEKLAAAARQAGEKAQKKAAELGVSARLIVESGESPSDIIIAKADEEKADLIVLGSSGKKGLKGVLIGSCAAKVAGYAHCSVLVVR
jgi:nucleotide-binding universal stress UspA family protein